MFRDNILGRRIAELRKAVPMTQEQFGQAFGYAKNAVSNIENGIRLVSVEKLVDIALYFNVSTDYLLGLTDEKD